MYFGLAPPVQARYVIVRTRVDPTRVLPAVRQVVHELDAGVPLANAATMEELIEQSLQRPRSLSVLVAGFAVVALILSLAGIGTRVIASLLFGVSAADPRIFVAVSATQLSVALVACVLPAQRSTRTDPAAVLREE